MENGQTEVLTAASVEGMPEESKYALAMRSSHFVQVRRRIFRQLVQSMLYEGIVGGLRLEPNHRWSCEIQGVSESGEAVVYICGGTRHLTFDRLRMDAQPLLRKMNNSEAEADSLALFLLETAARSGADEARTLHFIQELEQTLINDTLAQYERHQAAIPIHQQSYEDWESLIMDGHPYHPSYKSRIGFNVSDHSAYGPEFAQPIEPIWVAVQRKLARTSGSARLKNASFAQIDVNEWIGTQLSEGSRSKFAAYLTQLGVDRGAYVLLPVHPWQWSNKLTSVFAAQIREGALIPLGTADERYTAQQSIRTLANRTSPDKAYIKLALSILNTSTGRILAPHTVENAPLITDWLQGLAAEDSYLRDQLRVILLGEIAGAAYVNSGIPAALQPQAYGVLACIWRESLHPQLLPEESAVPFNALCATDLNSAPIIDPWIKRHGAEKWLLGLLGASVRPIIHFLFAHGIAIESHAQNMVLIHQAGMPQRVALKDFHDGIRFMKAALAEPDKCPQLVQVPEYHQRVNRNSFLETDDPAAVRDFVHDAFFFINLGELALFMEQHYDFSEVKFWQMVKQIILEYQQHFPEHAEQFERFSLFDAVIGVEQLTKRRLFPDDELRIHQVRNPLADS
ncbi:IucA/IucC family protein [Paenibacillus sp. KS-LC4]|uniref:IucA/IucC family protein n=1 Tax=Paenibacillus sp. KS-LC4 TaxID=2979727 RepID=UPI0030CEDC65